jgi:hypothetical protein
MKIKKYEYQVLLDANRKKLNEMGELGWKLVNVIQHKPNINTIGTREFYLRRRKID